MRSNIIYLLIIFLLYSCTEKENPKAQVFADYNTVVLNEGNFRSGNASVSLISLNNGSVLNQVFQSNNEGRPLGDVAQSMIQKDGKGYVVVNNSNKIEVVNLSDFKSVGSIQGLNSPRYILPVGGDRAYVSDLYQDHIYVVDLASLTVLNQIETKGWTEEMVLVQDEAFVCQVDSNQVWVIDVNSDSVISKINTAISPQSIVKDIHDKIWVACSGGFGQGFPTLIQIDPITKSEIQRFEIPDLNKSMGNLKTNANQDEIYYLSKDLFRMNISDTILPNAPFIAANKRTFYEFSIHPDGELIFISDAIDYQQSGVVYLHNSLGTEVGNFRVGLIPGFIYFIQ